MLRHIVWFVFAGFVISIGGLCPARAQERKDASEIQSPTRYSLAVIKAPGAKFEPAIYRIPDIRNVRFQTICESGLLAEIVEKGAVVTIQFSRKPLTKKTDPKLLEIGTHIESVKPMQFSPGDRPIIEVQNFAIAN
jgi:hypothetical protein